MTTAKTKTNEKLRDTIRQALRSQQQPTVTVLSSLLALQHVLHYLPDEAIEETASFCGSTINEVWSVASFYTNFRFTPPGEWILDVCWGPTCHLKGAQAVLKSVEEALGLSAEGETTDGKITLRFSTCLGACAQAPVIGIDHNLIGRVTPESAAEVATGLSKRDPRKAH